MAAVVEGLARQFATERDLDLRDDALFKHSLPIASCGSLIWVQRKIGLGSVTAVWQKES